MDFEQLFNQLEKDLDNIDLKKEIETFLNEFIKKVNELGALMIEALEQQKEEG